MRGMVDAAEPSANLPDDVGVLKSIIGEKTALLREQELRIAVLEEELRLAHHKRFGASSEKFDSNQPGLFDEAETLAAAPDADAAADGSTEVMIAEHTRRKGGRKPLSETLPRVRIEHDLAEGDKLCPCGSGHTRPRIGEMISEQADIVPATVQVLQHVRFKYGPCHACEGVFPEAPDACDAPAQQAEAAPVATIEPQTAVARLVGAERLREPSR